jgi:hypothetical protein
VRVYKPKFPPDEGKLRAKWRNHKRFFCASALAGAVTASKQFCGSANSPSGMVLADPFKYPPVKKAKYPHRPSYDRPDCRLLKVWRVAPQTPYILAAMLHLVCGVHCLGPWDRVSKYGYRSTKFQLLVCAVCSQSSSHTATFRMAPKPERQDSAALGVELSASCI